MSPNNKKRNKSSNNIITNIMAMTEIRQWNYPDTLDKLIMNELIKSHSFSAKRYTSPDIDPDMASLVSQTLADFDEWGYTTSELVFDSTTNTSYRVHTVTAFFEMMYTQSMLLIANEDKTKIDLWNAQQSELSPDERFNPG